MWAYERVMKKGKCRTLLQTGTKVRSECTTVSKETNDSRCTDCSEPFNRQILNNQKQNKKLGTNNRTQQKKCGKGTDFMRREGRCQTLQVFPFFLKKPKPTNDPAHKGLRYEHRLSI